MVINRFHWGVAHYIGSQLRQCVLDPDGVTLYSAEYGRLVPVNGRRLFAAKGCGGAAAAGTAAGTAAAGTAAAGAAAAGAAAH